MDSKQVGFVGKTSQPGTSTPPSLNPFYVTGLAEGEASLTYTRNGNSLNLRFAIKLPESDRNLIFSLQGFFGGGQVYRVDERTWMYCATSLDSIQKIVAHLDAFPFLGRKQAEYAIWRQMFDLKRVPRKIDLPTVTILADQLSALRPRGRGPINHD